MRGKGKKAGFKINDDDDNDNDASGKREARKARSKIQNPTHTKKDLDLRMLDIRLFLLGHHTVAPVHRASCFAAADDGSLSLSLVVVIGRVLCRRGAAEGDDRQDESDNRTRDEWPGRYDGEFGVAMNPVVRIEPTGSNKLINSRLRDLLPTQIRSRLRAPIHIKIRRSDRRPNRPPQRKYPTNKRSNKGLPALMQLEPMHESTRGGAVGWMRGRGKEEEDERVEGDDGEEELACGEKTACGEGVVDVDFDRQARDGGERRGDLGVFVAVIASFDETVEGSCTRNNTEAPSG